jgi:cytochrome c biogenesis protein CcmG/thiol:disulfide interchange protein DsbE
MSKRTMYALGGGAVAVGIVLIVIALTALSDGGGDDQSSRAVQRPTAPERPGQAGPTGSTGGAGATGGAGPSAVARGRALTQALEQRRRVRAPGFALPVLDKGTVPASQNALAQAVAGGSLALVRLRGAPVVLHVWSPECGPCAADARLIETTWQRWGRRGVAFVGLGVTDSAADALRFAREHDLSYPIVRDTGGRAADAYGVTALPATFFISGAGDVIGTVAGSASVRQMQLGTAAALAGRPFGSEQGGSREPRR